MSTEVEQLPSQDKVQQFENEPNVEKYSIQIRPLNVFIMSLLHMLALRGFFALMTSVLIPTVLYIFLLGVLTAISIGGGAHRLWAHRAYKAKLPLRLLLAVFFTSAMQNSIYEWCRDHRVHHKYSDTDADPHNSKRGFFFAHMGWLLCSKHPDVKSKGKSVDCSDLLEDPLIRFQHRYYLPLILLNFYLTTMIPVWGWSESAWLAFTVNVYRYVYVLHNTWLVNSWAHMFGMQPYDKSIKPRDTSLVAIQSYGEGYHNYHHTFPYDYSASELDWRYNFNVTTLAIDCFAAIGWAYDRRRVTDSVMKGRIERTGDKLEHEQTHDKSHGQRRVFNMLLAVIIATFHVWAPLLTRALLYT